MPPHPLRGFSSLLVALTFGANVFTLACDDAGPAAPPTVASAIPSSPTPSSSPQAPEPSVSTERASGLLDAWRSAQVRGDFGKYASLYADGFRGIKRVGEKPFEFDRKGWLEDRRSLFQHDVTVVVKDVRVFSGERSAVVLFVQEWATARFRDVGRKRMELVLKEGQLRIQREEMLDSATAAARGAPRPPPPEELALLIRHPRGFAAVLRTGTMKGVGPARRISPPHEYDHWVEKDATPSDIAAHQRLSNRLLDIHDGEKLACTGRVTGFVAMAGVVGPDEVEPDTPPDRRTEDVWEWADSARFLAAVIEPDTPKCTGQWARASDLPKPQTFAGRPPSPEEAQLALSSLLKTPGARKVTKDYDGYKTDVTVEGGHPADWWTLSPVNTTTMLFVDPMTQATYAAVEVSAGTGCGEFTGYAFGFFKVTPGRWIDVAGNDDPRRAMPGRKLSGMVPHTAVVIDPARPPVFVGEDVLYAQGPGGFEPVLTVGRIVTTCGC